MNPDARTPGGFPVSSERCTKDALLIVLSGESLGRIYKLLQPSTVIGCANSADITLSDEGVAWHHASIRLENKDVVLSILDTEHETYVNGEPIAEHTLNSGDHVQLGSGTILRFCVAETPETRGEETPSHESLSCGASAAPRTQPTASGVKIRKPSIP
jgi:pSer/pThr/pTyr-binding forkhead associated (FHA) protein